MLNPIFWKKVQGQKHPWMWGIVEHQIPGIKVLFKINTKSHKHPGINLLSSESKTQLVNQRKQKVAFNTGTAHSPEIQSYRMWWGAASPILNDTPVVCIYTSYNSDCFGENPSICVPWVISKQYGREVISEKIINLYNILHTFDYLIKNSCLLHSYIFCNDTVLTSNTVRWRS